MEATSKRTKKNRPMAEINVVPYIDVMLVLLVIFMITTPLLNQGVDIDLPQASAKPLATKTEPLIVSVDKEGRYYLNIMSNPEEPVTANDLAVRVAAEVAVAKKAGEERNVLIKGDQGVPYGKVVEAMVFLQQAGVEKVGLMTNPPPDNQS